MVLQHQVSGPGGSLKIANKSIVTVKLKKAQMTKFTSAKLQNMLRLRNIILQL